jgi:hypothetical protein
MYYEEEEVLSPKSFSSLLVDIMSDTLSFDKKCPLNTMSPNPIILAVVVVRIAIIMLGGITE